MQGVKVAACVPLCLKVMWYMNDLGELLREVKTLHALRGVSGIPRVLGYNTTPHPGWEVELLLGNMGRGTFA